MKKIIITIFTLALCLTAFGQSTIMKDFLPVCDSLDVLLKENRDVKGQLRLKSIMKRGKALDIYFTEYYQRNANQDHYEVPFHASQNGCDPKVYK